MAYSRKTASRYGGRRSAGRGSARRGSSGRSGGSRKAAPRRAGRSVTPRQQKVVVELVYRDASEIARPQGVVETRKGSKPKL